MTNYLFGLVCGLLIGGFAAWIGRMSIERARELKRWRDHRSPEVRSRLFKGEDAEF